MGRNSGNPNLVSHKVADKPLIIRNVVLKLVLFIPDILFISYETLIALLFSLILTITTTVEKR